MSFDDVILGSTEEHECSPTFDSFDELGIKINAPGEVEASYEDDGLGGSVVSASTRFPICISMQIPTAEIVKFPETSDRVTLVAVDQRTGDAFSRNLTSTRTRAKPTVYDLPQDMLENAIDIWRYNVNLCNYLRLPARAASYHIYATFEQYRSNSVTVEFK